MSKAKVSKTNASKTSASKKTSKASASKKTSQASASKKTSKASASKKASKAAETKAPESKTSKAPASKKTSKASGSKTSKAAETKAPESKASKTTASKMTKAPASKSLFEELGGHPAVDAAVDIFYRRVLADPRVARFFEDIDMDAQREKQKAFLTMVFGGPADYDGKDLRAAHARLVDQGLDDGHFDAVAEHLQATLERLKVPEPLVAKVMSIAGGTRGDVLNR